jgi:hypothetical protein
MAGPVDFPTVQWARKMGALTPQFEGLAPQDLRKLANFLEKLADYRAAEGQLSAAQIQVIMQCLHLRETLVKLETHKGGVFVEFAGGGYEYERFLLREDGKVPNNRYETKKVP